MVEVRYLLLRSERNALIEILTKHVHWNHCSLKRRGAVNDKKVLSLNLVHGLNSKNMASFPLKRKESGRKMSFEKISLTPTDNIQEIFTKISWAEFPFSLEVCIQFCLRWFPSILLPNLHRSLDRGLPSYMYMYIHRQVDSHKLSQILNQICIDKLKQAGLPKRFAGADWFKIVKKSMLLFYFRHLNIKNLSKRTIITLCLV